MGRDDFLVAPSNHAAVAWLDRWPDWPGPALVLHGPAGSGKTHLVHVWRARVLAAGEEAPILAAGALVGAAPEDLLSGCNAAIIENPDRRGVCGDRGAETGLFHLYNHLKAHSGHLLLTGRAAPVGWPFVLADLRSRLAAAPAAELGPPDDALIAAVLVKLFADRQLRVGRDVVSYVLSRMERSFAAARELVDALDRAALAEQRNITVPLARAVLSAGNVNQEGERRDGPGTGR